MNDEEALLAAVRENPSDTTLRLVYADWLDENGRDRQAAWMRTEIAFLANLLDVPGPIDPDWIRIRAELETAERNFDPSTLIDESLAGLSPEWRRGFAYHITVKVTECLQRLPEALARHPIMSVHVADGEYGLMNLRFRRGEIEAPASLAPVRGAASELQNGEWSVEYDRGIGSSALRSRGVHKWPNRAAMVAGVGPWLAAQLATPRR